MVFTLVDVILIVLVLVFVIVGFMMGLIQAVGAIIGVVLGAWAAGHFYQPVAGWLTPVLLGRATAATIIAFVLIFGVVNRLVAFIFYLINKIFHLISIIPFLGSINRSAGAILGLIEGVLAVGLIIYVITKFAANITWLMNNLSGSKVAHFLVWASSVLISLLPDALEKMKSIF